MAPDRRVERPGKLTDPMFEYAGESDQQRQLESLPPSSSHDITERDTSGVCFSVGTGQEFAVLTRREIAATPLLNAIRIAGFCFAHGLPVALLPGL